MGFQVATLGRRTRALREVRFFTRRFVHPRDPGDVFRSKARISLALAKRLPLGWFLQTNANGPKLVSSFVVSWTVPSSLRFWAKHEVAQGIQEVHVVHEVPKEPRPNAQWRRS